MAKLLYGWGRKRYKKKRERRDGTRIGIDRILKREPCYESPKKERVSHAFENLIDNIKSYNEVK